LGRGRPKITWNQVVQSDLQKWKLKERDALNQEFWKAAVKRDPALNRVTVK
jgi:hypothetical protein